MGGVVLVTGCSSGIGRATADRLARAGYTVWATARRPETLGDLEALGCRTVRLDVTDEGSMTAAVAAVDAEHGRVDVLVNNAGFSQSGAVETVSMADLRRQFETNVFGLVRMCQLVLPAMRAAGSGRIVNIGSMGGRLTFPGAGAYHATKHAVEALSDSLRFEVQGFGVQVVLLEPGLITTDFAEAALTSLNGVGDGTPYAAFNLEVGSLTAEAYTGPMSRLGGGPEQVAAVVQRAVEARRPRSRYRVTASAKVILTGRRMLPDRAWDAAMRTLYPVPGRDEDRAR